MLEEQLVDLVVYAMERSETEEHFDADIGGTSQLLWQHLSSQLIFFVLFQFASFPHMVLSLHQKVRKNTEVVQGGIMILLMSYLGYSHTCIWKIT